MVTTVLAGLVQMPGGQSALSGTNPVSGVSGVGALSGPWYVEEQTLQIKYKRVPGFRFQHGSVNLSAANITTGSNPLGTYLIEEVWPRVSKMKLEGDYSTSTYTQPQRFTVFPVSADYTGMTYGTPVAGTLSVGGWILTSQPYYFRRLWTAQDQIDAQGWTNPPPGTTSTGIHDFRQWEEHPNSPCRGLAAGIAWGASFRPIHQQDCFVDALIDPTNGGWGQPHRGFSNYNLGSVTFWDTVAGATSRDTEVQMKEGPNYWTNACTPEGGIVKKNGLLDNHRLGWKIGAYNSTLDSVNDVRPYVDDIATIISKPFPLGASGTPADYFVGTQGGVLNCQGIFAMNNVYYEKSRHYWGA